MTGNMATTRESREFAVGLLELVANARVGNLIDLRVAQPQPESGVLLTRPGFADGSRANRTVVASPGA